MLYGVLIVAEVVGWFNLLLFTFLIFRHLAKLFFERRRNVFGSRLRTRLVLAFITLTLMPTLFLFVMSWQLMSSRVDYSWDRQVELSLDQALAVSRTVSRQLKGKLLASGREVSLELIQRENRGREDPGSLEAFFKQRREDFHLTGLELLDPKGTVVAASFTSDLDQPPPPIPPSDEPAAPAAEKIIRQVIQASPI